MISRADLQLLYKRKNAKKHETLKISYYVVLSLTYRPTDQVGYIPDARWYSEFDGRT